MEQKEAKVKVNNIVVFLVIIITILFVVIASNASNTKTISPTPVTTQQAQSGNDVAFCAMVKQYLEIVNGDQVSVTDKMVVAGLEVIADKARGTRFEATANRALSQSKTSNAQGLITSLNELARDCRLQ
ncbi:MAG: hypothetical protein WC011_00085 [Candidatus Paceibacterota bacterium]